MREFLEQFYTARTASAYRAAGDGLAARAARSRATTKSPVAGEGARARAPASAAAIPKEVLVASAARRRSRRDRGVALRAQGPARAHLAAAARRARRVHAPGAEERRAESQGVPRASGSAGDARQARALTELADALELPEPPHRIECYDISNIQGTNPVASMVVFVEGRAKKSDYRKFKIQYDQGPERLRDDAGDVAPALALSARTTTDDGDVEQDRSKRSSRRKRSSTRSPICCLIDGGKGQLSAVVEVLRRTRL